MPNRKLAAPSSASSASIESAPAASPASLASGAVLGARFSLASASRTSRVGAALLFLAASAAAGALVMSGQVRSLESTVFHIPCPACGSTRAVRALLQGDVMSALRMHAMAPFGALWTLAIVMRAAWLIARDGTVRALGEGPTGGALVKAGVAVVVLEFALYTARWFGMFGGPVPV